MPLRLCTKCEWNRSVFRDSSSSAIKDLESAGVIDSFKSKMTLTPNYIKSKMILTPNYIKIRSIASEMALKNEY